MSIRDNREQQSRVPALRGSRARRRPGRRLALTRWTALALLAGLVFAAFAAPAGQAHGTRERSPEEEAALVASKEAKNAERQERKQAESEERAANKAQQESERSAARSQGTENGGVGSSEGGRRVQNGSRLRLHGGAQFSCTGVTWSFTEFPEASNTVVTVVHLEGEEAPITISKKFTFVGPSAEFTTPFHAPPGTYRVDAWAKWKGDGLKGSFDILGKLTCRPAPAVAIEKLQMIAGGGGSFTSAPITGEVGDTVDYEIIVKNEGNVALTLSEFTDSHCGPVSGGPGSGTLAVGASTIYRCTHVLEEPGPYTNKAEVVATPPEGDGNPIGGTSNTVVVETSPLPPTPAPAFSLEKLQEIAGAPGSYTSSELTGAAGQTVNYEIIVHNTGNVPLTLGSFTDPQCDPGTLAGGTEGAALPVGATTTYTCTHLLDAGDVSAGSYANTVSVTGTPPLGGGSPVTNSSNTVVVTLPAPAGSGGNAPATGSAGAGSSGVLSSTFSEPAKSGVLAFSSVKIPAMKGPQGCVRHKFRISIKSANVASVTFYLDKHKLKTLTAKNARKGLLTIEINPAKLKVGVHKLLAKITMKHTASTKAKQGSRSVRILRCSSDAVTPKFTG